MEKFNKPIMVTKSSLPSLEKYVEKISKIWDSRWLTNKGEFHEEFKVKLQKYLDVENVNLFVNGHLALEIAIKALNITGEVITTPFTFASTTHALVNMGCTPVFCDINLNDFTMDTTKIEELITEKTTAIMPVHVFGYPCNVVEIERIAKKHNLKVIYDAAHVFGVKINGKGIGSFGDISMFSLHATKVMHSIEGGILTYNNSEYKRNVGLLKNFGITGPEEVASVGSNAKMNEFAAVMGILNMDLVEGHIAARKEAIDSYREVLKDIKGIMYLDDMEGITHNYSYFPIIVKHEEIGITRDELFEKLKEYNVFTRKYFYPLVPDFNCYKETYKDISIPNARYVGERVLTLPIYAELTKEEARDIALIVKEIIEGK